MARRFYSRETYEESGPLYWVMILFIVISLILMVTQSAGVRDRGATQSFADDRIAPFVGLASKPLNMIESFFLTLEDRQRAFEENVVLRRELQILRDNQTYVSLLENKIATYEKILNVSYDPDNPIEKIAARAVSEVEGPFVRGLLINAGRKQKIEQGDVLMTPDGMVGHVISVGKTSSRVLRLDDLNSRIPVISERSRSVAILAGDNNDFPKLTFMGRGEDWQIGDRVITSGDEGLLPRGLYIGEVVEFDKGYYRVRADGLQTSIDWAFIPKFPDIISPDLEAEDGEETLDEGAAGNDDTTQTLPIFQTDTASQTEGEPSVVTTSGASDE